MNTIRVSNGLDPDQDPFVCPENNPGLVYKGYRQMTKVAARKERVKC